VLDETTWYPRLGDVPGVNFTGSPGIDRSKLRDAKKRPTKTSYGLDWETRDGSTSASPVHEHTYSDQEVSTKTLVKRTWEALELPGVVSDWHFLLMNTVRTLWNQRAAEPQFLADCEAFCRLDLQIITSHPHLFALDKRDDGPEYLSLPTIPILVKLLRACDDLDEALAVARTGVRFNPETLDRPIAEIEALLQERV
jgi:hypothetical protein